MKMLGSFVVGAAAGFLLATTKQGCAVRKGLDLFVGRFFCADSEISEEPLMDKIAEKALQL